MQAIDIMSESALNSFEQSQQLHGLNPKKMETKPSPTGNVRNTYINSGFRGAESYAEIAMNNRFKAIVPVEEKDEVEEEAGKVTESKLNEKKPVKKNTPKHKRQTNNYEVDQILEELSKLSTCTTSSSTTPTAEKGKR